MSVIVPARNATQTLGTQLRALTAQLTELRWELLICDNGSTDDTPEIARGFCGQVPDLRVIDASERRGPAAARNVGAAAARAPLLLFCDADDRADAHWIGRMRAALQDADLACGGWEGELLNRDSRFGLSWSPVAEYRKDYLPGLPAGAANNMGVRADVFAASGGFDESMLTSEDIDLAWRVQLAGHRFVFVPDAVMHVRRRSGVRAVWEQGFSYGRGEFRLRHKYAKVIAAYRAEAARDRAAKAGPAPTAPGLPTARPPLAAAAQFGTKLLRFRGPLQLPDRLWRFALRTGERTGSVDPSWTQLEPPASLPHN